MKFGIVNLFLFAFLTFSTDGMVLTDFNRTVINNNSSNGTPNFFDQLFKICPECSYNQDCICNGFQFHIKPINQIAQTSTTSSTPQTIAQQPIVTASQLNSFTKQVTSSQSITTPLELTPSKFNEATKLNTMLKPIVTTAQINSFAKQVTSSQPNTTPLELTPSKFNEATQLNTMLQPIVTAAQINSFAKQVTSSQSKPPPLELMPSKFNEATQLNTMQQPIVTASQINSFAKQVTSSQPSPTPVELTPPKFNEANKLNPLQQQLTKTTSLISTLQQFETSNFNNLTQQQTKLPRIGELNVTTEPLQSDPDQSSSADQMEDDEKKIGQLQQSKSELEKHLMQVRQRLETVEPPLNRPTTVPMDAIQNNTSNLDIISVLGIQPPTVPIDSNDDPKSQCQDTPKVFGHCSQPIEAWSYITETANCQNFTYSGCGMSTNIFWTEEDCLRKCQGVKKSKSENNFDLTSVLEDIGLLPNKQSQYIYVYLLGGETPSFIESKSGTSNQTDRI